MTAIDSVIAGPAAQAIGWALLHFVWQGALIGVITGVVLASLRRSAADVRYVVSTVALSLMLTMPVMTAVQQLGSVEGPGAPGAVDTASPPAARSAALMPSAAASQAVDASTTPAIDREMRLESWLPMCVAIWAAGVFVLTLRLVYAWIYVQRLKTHGAAAADPALRAVTARLSLRLHLTRTVRLLQSSIVEVPMVIGWLKPVVLLPIGALAGLTSTQLEAILAHELAHIRRHDYLVNLLQTLVETLLFYHPAVWWLSRRIRIERENCCDDLAVSLCGDPVAYARALADLEGLRGSGGHLAVAADGGFLLQRVRRLLGAPSHSGRGPGWLAGSVAILLMCGIAAGAPAATLRQLQADAAKLREQARALAEQARKANDQTTLAQAEEALRAMDAARAAVDNKAIVNLQATLAAASTQLDHVRLDENMHNELTAAAARLAAASEALLPVTAAIADMTPALQTSEQSSGNFVWSNNGDKIEINYKGDFEFSDDDTDVKRMSPGAYLRISDGAASRAKKVEFSADTSGNITRRFSVGGSERPFEPEGRQWLAQALPRFIRQSGIGARGRVARIYKSQGTDGVLAEISRIDGSWARRVYFNELFKQNGEASTIARALEQAGRQIDSDYELSSLLIGVSDKAIADESGLRAYFDAARSIDSDYEMRRAFSAALKPGPLNGAALASMLDTAKNIDSDYELASLLVDVAKQQSIETARAPFFQSVNAMHSDYERARVLLAVAGRPDASNETVIAVLRAVKGMSSGSEAGRVLQAVVAKHTVSGEARDAYIAATDRLGEYEQGRALAALMRSEKR